MLNNLQVQYTTEFLCVICDFGEMAGIPDFANPAEKMTVAVYSFAFMLETMSIFRIFRAIRLLTSQDTRKVPTAASR